VALDRAFVISDFSAINCWTMLYIYTLAILFVFNSFWSL